MAKISQTYKEYMNTYTYFLLMYMVLYDNNTTAAAKPPNHIIFYYYGALRPVSFLLRQNQTLHIPPERKSFQCSGPRKKLVLSEVSFAQKMENIPDTLRLYLVLFASRANRLLCSAIPKKGEKPSLVQTGWNNAASCKIEIRL